MQRHFPSLLMNVTFLHFFVAQLSRAKGCHRTQQTSGRMRLATELANDAANSLHWLAGHKDSSLTRSILPSGAISVTRVFDASRQGTSEDDALLSALLKGMSDYSVSSSPGNLASYKPHIFDLVLSTGRWCLEEEQQRMRRDPEEIEEVALPQVYNDPGPKRNQKLHLVRDVKSRGTLSATLSSR